MSSSCAHVVCLILFDFSPLSSLCCPSSLLSSFLSSWTSTSSSTMWWTNSLCTSANEDLSTLVEYDPLTQDATSSDGSPVAKARPTNLVMQGLVRRRRLNIKYTVLDRLFRVRLGALKNQDVLLRCVFVPLFADYESTNFLKIGSLCNVCLCSNALYLQSFASVEALTVP